MSRGLFKKTDQLIPWRDPEGPFIGKRSPKSASQGQFQGPFGGPPRMIKDSEMPVWLGLTKYFFGDIADSWDIDISKTTYSEAQGQLVSLDCPFVPFLQSLLVFMFS